MLAFNHLGSLGRLGNQMFEYAALRGIAAHHGYEWCIPPSDRKGIENYSLHECFKLAPQINEDVKEFQYVQEPHFHFSEELFEKCPDNVSLYGFFQSEKYFKHIENQIREDFVWRDDVWNTCKEIFDQIVPDGKAISLHVRRTDQVVKSKYHPVQPNIYYEKALAKFPELPVIVFSDEPNWVKKEKFFSDDRFLVSDSSDNIHDMCLMSMCSHHIMVNSTFSWWGAWLSGSKHVIAPTNWFGSEAGLDDKDLVPERWERIDA
jgi:hypothetical protein